MGTPWNCCLTSPNKLLTRSVQVMKHRRMKYRIALVVAAVAMFGGLATADDEKSGAANHKISRTADGHPDLSGLWAYTIDLPPVLLKTQVNGAVSLKSIDRSARELGKGAVPGALPWTPAP